MKTITFRKHFSIYLHGFFVWFPRENVVLRDKQIVSQYGRDILFLYNVK